MTLDQMAEYLRREISGLRGDVNSLRTGQDSLRGDVNSLGAGQDSLRSDMDSLGEHLSTRIDRLQDALERRLEGEVVNHDPAEKAMRLARDARDGEVNLREQIGAIMRPMRRLETEVRELRERGGGGDKAA